MTSLLSIINKYSTNGIINNVPEEELRKALMELSSSPQKESTRHKRTHDPDAPKRPTSAYMFWLNENRQDIKDTYFSDFDKNALWDFDSKKEYYSSKGLKEPDKEGKPRIVALVTTKAGLLWKKLSDEEKQPFDDKFKEAQEEYVSLKSSYIPKRIESIPESLQDAPDGWSEPHREFMIDKTVKDEDGKTIKIFKSFTDAIEKANSLGIKCYGITQTKRGFSVRTGSLKQCDKSIASWTKLDFEAPIKSKRGRPQKSSSEEDTNTGKELTKDEENDNDSDSDSDSDNEMEVDEITIDGKLYFLNVNTKDVYDPESQECLGKYMDGKIVEE
jgi:hypothetical protein